MTYWLWAPSAGERLTPRRASMQLFAGHDRVESRLLEAEVVTALCGSPPRFVEHDVGLWLAHQISVPLELRVTRIEYELEVAVIDTTHRLTVVIDVTGYEQQVTLVFPVVGNFAILFGHASEGDHMERSQAFAYDIAPLGKKYELLRDGDGSQNEHFAGWGTDVRAPAAGVVVRVQAEVPDNPAPGAVIDLDARPEGRWAMLGNGLVIDHGNSEFSLLGHLMQGSLMVRQGHRVDAGQIVGAVGNSGHSSGPHLHYHLMDGPELFRSNGLPSHFLGTETPTPRRGAMETAE